MLNAHGTASAGRVVVAVDVTGPGTVELVGLNITGGYNEQVSLYVCMVVCTVMLLLPGRRSHARGKRPVLPHRS